MQAHPLKAQKVDQNYSVGLYKKRAFKLPLKIAYSIIWGVSLLKINRAQ